MLDEEDQKLADEALKESRRIMDNTDCREYRYQRDWSIGTQMFHVRCDDWEQFKAAVANMEDMIPSNKPFPDDTGDHATSQVQAVNAPVCGIHKVPMVMKPAGVSKAGRAYPAFWSCPSKNQDGSFCTYRSK